MTLELMHGPVTMTIDPEDSTIGGVAGFNGPRQCGYEDEHGWFGVHDPSNMTGCGLSGLVTSNIDGVTRLRSYLPSAFQIIQFEQDDLTNNVSANYGSAIPFLFNPTVCGPDPFIALNSMLSTKIRTRVGWFLQSGSNVQRAPLDATDNLDFATVFTFSPGVTLNSARWHYTLGPDNIIFLYTGDATNPLIVAYDYVLNTEVFPNPTGSTVRWELDHQVDKCVYSRKHGVFFTYEEDGLIAGQGILHVYSTELGPSALSAPTDDPVITAGAVSTISVTLTDDQGTGIPGRLIDWSITVGNGTLLDLQTTTNQDGIATTQYRAEITGGVDPTIQAELTY